MEGMLLQYTYSCVYRCKATRHTLSPLRTYIHFLQLPSGGGVEDLLGPRPLIT